MSDLEIDQQLLDGYKQAVNPRQATQNTANTLETLADEIDGK